MFDWTHYTQSAGDLTGVGGQLKRVSAEELAKHDTEEDAWTAVRGTVASSLGHSHFFNINGLGMRLGYERERWMSKGNTIS